MRDPATHNAPSPIPDGAFGMSGGSMPCLDCGRPGFSHRCPGCRRTTTQRGYGWQWQQLVREVLHEWRMMRGELCPGYLVPSHYATPGNPLTGDHTRAMARGGPREASYDDVQVLCRACNSRKRDRGGRVESPRRVTDS